MKPPIPITPAALAARFIGTKEIPGAEHNPLVVAMLQHVNPNVRDDETAWCSAFANYVAWLLDCARPNSLAARAWLRVGTPVFGGCAYPGFHVVILKRGIGLQPGPEVINAPGHVGFFDGFEGDKVWLIGGNQSNAVTRAAFPRTSILGIREI